MLGFEGLYFYSLASHTLPRKQVFRVKKLVGLLPQLELLAVVSRKLGHDNVRAMQLHMPNSMGTQTQTDYTTGAK